LLALAVSACSGGGKQEAASEVQPAAVRAVPAASVEATSQTRAVGVLAPRDEIRLAFKVGGVVDTVSVDSGDVVRKGQLLAALKRAEVDASVTQAAEAVEKARRDLERAKQLRIDEVATEEQVQDLTTAYNVARSNLQAIRFNASFARIEAPVDGIVFDRMVEAGELVQPGQPVVVLGSTGSGWVVRVGLADRDAVRMETGAPAQVTFEVQPDGARFARGLVAKVALPLAQLPDVASTATVVPVTALVDADGKQATVFVLDRQKNLARRKQVALGPLLGDQVVVTAGLVAGDAVITDGAAWLTDGRAVRVVGANGPG
jgi:multidrug efflux pump subunit AcrA (membrane-fusion protein)